MTDIANRIGAPIPRPRRYARALTLNEVVADDLVQDCLVRALTTASETELKRNC
jgi:DNA-directed RNA polymerase specialized sigma24 family protein